MRTKWRLIPKAILHQIPDLAATSLLHSKPGYIGLRHTKEFDQYNDFGPKQYEEVGYTVLKHDGKCVLCWRVLLSERPG